MVKLNWLEEFVIYIIVGAILIFFVNKMNFDMFYSWVSVIFWLIIYLVVSSIIIKLIKGKDNEEPKQNKKLGNWLKKQKTWKKNLIIIASVVIIICWIGSLFFWSSEDTNNGVDTKYVQENFNRLIKEDLSEMYGYEVISVGNYGDLNKSYSYLSMKSLGSKDEQVWNGLTTLWSYSEMAGYNVYDYSVSILSPTDECYYHIDGV